MTPCSRCEKPTAQRVEMILNALSGDDDWEANLSEWEQEFLVSVRQQFAKKGAVSEKQYEILERIWQKVNS